MPAGAIVLLKDGDSCSLGTKFFGAQQLGPGAIVFFDAAGGTWVKVTEIGIPSAATLETVTALTNGREQGATGLTARLKVDWRPGTYETSNVIAETRDGDPASVIVVGAHLDSVGPGAGIDHNGSGSATILEIPEQIRKVKPRHKNRFILFRAEEHGLLGWRPTSTASRRRSGT
jgi:Zn-dependent M28 family amino/carboxypeptidase